MAIHPVTSQVKSAGDSPGLAFAAGRPARPPNEMPRRPSRGRVAAPRCPAPRRTRRRTRRSCSGSLRARRRSAGTGRPAMGERPRVSTGRLASCLPRVLCGVAWPHPPSHCKPCAVETRLQRNQVQPIAAWACGRLPVGTWVGWGPGRSCSVLGSSALQRGQSEVPVHLSLSELLFLLSHSCSHETR